MKKSVRLFLTGSVQPMFFGPYIKEQADLLKIRGYVRSLEDGKIEIFLEGDINSIEAMIPKCKQGPYNTHIRNMEQKDERFQDFKDFRIVKI